MSEVDYSDVSVTAGSVPELQMLLQGLMAKYPNLNPERLVVDKTAAPGTIRVIVADNPTAGGGA